MDIDKKIQTAEFVASMLDSRFSFMGVTFGLTAILDLIPEVGDILAFLVSLYIIRLAMDINVPKIILARMFLNVGINLFIGLIPVIGDITYIVRKTNMHNLTLLKEYVRRTS